MSSSSREGMGNDKSGGSDKRIAFAVSPAVVLPSFSLICVALRGLYSYFKRRPSTSSQQTGADQEPMLVASGPNLRRR